MLRVALSVAVAAIGLAVAGAVAATLWMTADLVDAQRQASERAEARGAALGVCIVELLMVDPDARALSDVRRVCPDGVVELMLRERMR